jgi:hypothetical protein
MASSLDHPLGAGEVECILLLTGRSSVVSQFTAAAAAAAHTCNDGNDNGRARGQDRTTQMRTKGNENELL